MSVIHKTFFRLLLIVICAATLGGVLHAPLQSIFFHNIPLNTVIISVLMVGIGVNFFNLFILRKDFLWLKAYDSGREDYPDIPKPQALAPIAIVMANTKEGAYLSSTAVRSLLMSIEARLASQRDLSRYLTGILIFLGLLGTFWGLSQTIGAVASVVSHLHIDGGDVSGAFQNLKEGIQSPLAGMGTAFSSSLLGLAGSLLVGSLDLQLQSAYKTFYEQIEERLTACIRTFSQDSEAPIGGPAYTQSLLEQSIEASVQLQNMLRSNEERYIHLMQGLKHISDIMKTMQQQQIAYHQLLTQLSEGQINFNQNITQLMKDPMGSSQSVMHLKNMEELFKKMIEEMKEGQGRLSEDFRNETRLVARTISAMTKNNAA